jgi:hypothetical protein
MKTYMVKCYAGTYPYRSDLKMRGFVWEPEDGGAWVKRGVTPEIMEVYERKQYGEWVGMVWVKTEEKTK